MDVGSILLDEAAAGEAEAEARIAINVASDLEKAKTAATEGAQVVRPPKLCKRGVGSGSAGGAGKSGGRRGSRTTHFLFSHNVSSQVRRWLLPLRTQTKTVPRPRACARRGWSGCRCGESDCAVHHPKHREGQCGELIVTRYEFDPETPNTLRRVEEVFEHIVHGLSVVTLRSSTGRTQTLHTTAEHPVYVPGRGWVGCRELGGMSCSSPLAASRPCCLPITSDIGREFWCIISG